LLVTPSIALARQVAAEVEAQTRRLSRQDAIRKVMKNGMLIVVVKSVADGMDLCNRFAPEHLELMVRNAGRWVARFAAPAPCSSGAGRRNRRAISRPGRATCSRRAGRRPCSRA